MDYKKYKDFNIIECKSFDQFEEFKNQYFRLIKIKKIKKRIKDGL